MKIDDQKEIAEQIKGKEVETATIAIKSVVIKFTDGTFLDIDLATNELLTKLSDK